MSRGFLSEDDVRDRLKTRRPYSRRPRPEPLAVDEFLEWTENTGEIDDMIPRRQSYDE